MTSGAGRNCELGAQQVLAFACSLLLCVCGGGVYFTLSSDAGTVKGIN